MPAAEVGGLAEQPDGVHVGGGSQRVVARFVEVLDGVGHHVGALPVPGERDESQREIGVVAMRRFDRSWPPRGAAPSGARLDAFVGDVADLMVGEGESPLVDLREHMAIEKIDERAKQLLFGRAGHRLRASSISKSRPSVAAASTSRRASASSPSSRRLTRSRSDEGSAIRPCRPALRESITDLPAAGFPIEQPLGHRRAQVLGDEERVAAGVPDQELQQARPARPAARACRRRGS